MSYYVFLGNYIVCDLKNSNYLSYFKYSPFSCIPLEHYHEIWAANVLIFNHAALQHTILAIRLPVF